jgi:hypothetical protein
MMIMVVVAVTMAMTMTVSTVMSVTTVVVMVATGKSECSQSQGDDGGNPGEAKLHTIFKGLFFITGRRRGEGHHAGAFLLLL